MKNLVIIPTYNRAGWITKTVQSILDQTHSKFEIIVVDDGSTDNTTGVLEAIKDPRVSYFKIINQERGAARNFGRLKSKGDYIVFIELLYFFWNQGSWTNEANITL